MGKEIYIVGPNGVLTPKHLVSSDTTMPAQNKVIKGPDTRLHTILTPQRAFNSNIFCNYFTSLGIENGNKNPILAKGRAERLQKDSERGLRVLSRSKELTDFSVLESAYPEEKTEWQVLVNEVRKLVERQRKENIPELDIFDNVCNHINTWFTKRNLVLLTSYTQESERNSKGILRDLGLGQIAAELQYEFKGKQIPLYFEWTLANQNVFSELGRMHNGRMITLDLSMLAEAETCPWDPKHTTDYSDDVLTASGYIPSLHRVQTRLIRELRNKNNPAEYLVNNAEGVAIEELRHWLDHITIRDESKKDYSIYDLSQYDYFGKTQTSGTLKELNQAAPLGFLSFELAGKFTKGALGPRPKDHLIGHLRILANKKHRKTCEFGIATLYVRLLGDELQLRRSTARLSPSNWNEVKIRDLSKFLDDLSDVSNDNYANACKRVLEKNYKYPYHEGFFHS